MATKKATKTRASTTKAKQKLDETDLFATRLMIVFVTLSFIFAGMAYLHYG